jgi:hypothetical protein
MGKRRQLRQPKPDPFSDLYPNVAEWVKHDWIEIGHDDMNRPFIRVMDIGGEIWNGDDFDSVHEALLAAETAIAAWLAEHG